MKTISKLSALFAIVVLSSVTGCAAEAGSDEGQTAEAPGVEAPKHEAAAAPSEDDDAVAAKDDGIPSLAADPLARVHAPAPIEPGKSFPRPAPGGPVE